VAGINQLVDTSKFNIYFVQKRSVNNCSLTYI